MAAGGADFCLQNTSRKLTPAALKRPPTQDVPDTHPAGPWTKWQSPRGSSQANLEAISQAGGQKLTLSLRNSCFFALLAGAESCWKIQGTSPRLWASTCLIQGIRVSLRASIYPLAPSLNPSGNQIWPPV